MGQKVAILGASANPDRYAHMALKMLQTYKHTPIPVNPTLQEIEDIPVLKSLSEIQSPVDTLTMYVGPEKSNQMKQDILALKPKRVIFNPGSENPPLMDELEKAGVHVVTACTLVLLRTEQFDKA